MIAIENIQSIGPWGYSRDIESLLRKQLFRMTYSNFVAVFL